MTIHRCALGFLLLLILGASGCTMQRTDVLTQEQADRLTQANQKLMQGSKNPLTSRIASCNRSIPKGAKRRACIQQAVNSVRSQFVPVLSAYKEAARSVSGNCHDGLQAIYRSLQDLDGGFARLSRAAHNGKSLDFQKASDFIARALQNLVRVQDVKDCSVSKTA